jgi:STE24 endopeptidase
MCYHDGQMASIASLVTRCKRRGVYRQTEATALGARREREVARLLTPQDIDRERQEEARAFARLRHRLLLLETVLGGAFAVLVLASGLSYRLSEWLGGLSAQPYLLVGGYALVFMGAYGVLMAPVAYYGGFSLPHRYGLSTQTKRAWVVDEAKSALLGWGLGLVVVEVIYYLLRVTPQVWWIVAGAFLLGLSVILTTVAPVVLVPLFYKLTLLGDEELVARLTSLAERAEARVRGVFTIDLSSKSRAANAMLMGLGKTRRIVLGDTLYEDFTGDEIEVILAHELGHHVGHDIWWGLAFQSVVTLGALYATHLALGWGVDVMGLGGLDDVSGLPVLALVMGAFMAVTMPLGNGFSRWREGLADEYALRLTGKPGAFVSVMVRLANQNLADVDPERWVELLLHSHPAISKRIERGQRFCGEGGCGEVALGGEKARWVS